MALAATDLVIFDCDGVLVDSEIIAVRVDAALLREEGIELAPEEIARRYCGLSYASMCRALERDFGRAIPDDFEARSQRATLEAFERELEAVPAVKDVLDRLTLPRCVASSSDPERIERSLRITGLYERLEPHLFSVKMVARGKPAPDLFLHAAKQMGAHPARCVVIEDSPHGVEAGRAAGMRVLGFSGASHADAGHAERLREAGAEHTFDDMHRLPELIAATVASA